ncbi:MAG: histidine phosphatase family protein [Candidatus Kerfeldbacteria bacterium]
MRSGNGELPFEGDPTKEKQEFGKNVEVTVSFRRHADPEVNPATGMSADKLSSKGIEQAAALGAAFEGPDDEAPVVKGYSSKLERAKDTIDIGLQNTGATVINRKVAEIGDEEVRTSRGARTYNIRTREELMTVKNVAPFWMDAGKRADAMIAAGELDKPHKLDYQIQAYLDGSEQVKAAGGQTARECAQDLGHLLQHYLEMSGHLYDGSNVKLENVTHGPKIEPFIREVVMRTVGNETVRGFKNLDEIGGAFKPTDNVDFVIRRDDEGKLSSVKMMLRGTEYDVDLAELGLLSEEYATRQKVEKVGA